MNRCPEEILDHLDRTTDQIFGRDDFLARLTSGRQLRIKFGVDCTAPHLHLGHAVNLWMMRYLQDHGHVIVFLIGDTTTRIGDPTGRSATRPMLAAPEIERNADAFLAQVTMILRDDPDVLEIRRNSEWYDTMAITDLISELSFVTHNQLLSRDMFRNRLQNHREIAMHELIYPILQGFDSVALHSDLTIVGSDQLFNEMMGRQLQAKHGQLPQTVITSTITPGLDGGAKQSKSLNNYVGLTQPAEEKFGRLMTLRDDLLGIWARVYTELPLDIVEEFQHRADRGGSAARDAKLDLAETIVARYHGGNEAIRARRDFSSIFSERKLPEQMPDLAVSAERPTVLDLVALARPELTRSAARRLINEGGVRINGAQIREPHDAVAVKSGDVLQIGKRHWFSLTRTA